MELQLREGRVRDWRESDAEALARNADARSIWLNMRDAFGHPYTLRDAQAFLERAVPTFWCIEVDGEAAGGIGLMPGPDVERFCAELKGDGPPVPRHALTILAVSDLPGATAFYDAALGWPHVVDVPVYVELQHPAGQRLGLYAEAAFSDTTQRPVRSVAGDHVASAELYFYVPDLDAALDRLRAAGAELLSPRAIRPWGDEAAYARDPFGHVIVVARPSARRAP